MEFNNETDMVIGIVDHKLGSESARIKVLAIANHKKNFQRITESQAIDLFPPKGFVFEPRFFHNYTFVEKDIISFGVIENEQSGSDRDRDIYRINTRGSVKKFGIDARNINGFSKNGYSTDLTNLHIAQNDNQSNGDFYGITGKYVIGKLRLHNGVIIPAHHNRIKVWDIENINKIEYKFENDTKLTNGSLLFLQKHTSTI